jgi:hypothetical protein
MKESISSSERMSTRWRKLGERTKRQELDRLRELEELRDLCDNQARIIESMQKSMDRKVIHRDEWKRIAKERGAILTTLGYRENAWSDV